MALMSTINFFFFLKMTQFYSHKITIMVSFSYKGRAHIPVGSQNSEDSTLVCNFLRYLQKEPCGVMRWAIYAPTPASATKHLEPPSPHWSESSFPSVRASRKPARCPASKLQHTGGEKNQINCEKTRPKKGAASLKWLLALPSVSMGKSKSISAASSLDGRPWRLTILTVSVESKVTFGKLQSWLANWELIMKMERADFRTQWERCLGPTGWPGRPRLLRFLQRNSPNQFGGAGFATLCERYRRLSRF